MIRRSLTVYFIVLIPILYLFGENEASNVETYTYEVNVKETVCYPISYQVCGGWWFWRNCRTESRTQCDDRYVNRERVGQRCKPGWTDLDSGCLTAICNPPCTGGNFCVSPNLCQCKGSGTYCDITACSDANNCYPGTCSGGSCNCPLGFSGPNCLQMTLKPVISECQAIISVGNPSKVAIQMPCTHEGQTPEPIWTNASQPNSIQMRFRAEYQNYVNLPGNERAPHVQNAPVVLGVTTASFTTSLNNNEFQCQFTSGANGNPRESVRCDWPTSWADISAVAPVHQQQMLMSILARLGGFKTGAKLTQYPGSNFNRQDFVGNPQTSKILVQFDLFPPTHCLTGKSTATQADCPTYAIYLENDVTTKSRFDIYFYNWTDPDSGIVGYDISVFFMQPGADNRLVNTGSPVVTGSKKPNENFFTFNLLNSGVYAIEVTVRDKAGNEARARKIVLYDNKSKMTTNSDKPIRFLESNPNSGGKWITNVVPNRDRDNSVTLTLDWSGHFISNAKYADGWTNEVVPWNEGIDDRFGASYGKRSIDRLSVSGSGIIVYNLAYVTDDQGGRGLTSENQTWMSFNATTERTTLTLSGLNNGDSIVVWVNANDIVGSGNDDVEKIIAHLDTTYPEITAAEFKSKLRGEFTSSIQITVKDKESGIGEIHFQIYDKTSGGLMVYNGTAPPIDREAPQQSLGSGRKKRAVQQPCTDNTTCYCIRAERVCYSEIQEIVIDHCWIDRLSGHSFEIRYTVENNANITTKEQKLDLGTLNNIPCRPSGLSGGAIAGLVIGLLIGAAILALLIFIVVTVVRVKYYNQPQPQIVNRLQKTFRNASANNELYEPADDIQAGLRNRGPGENIRNNRNLHNELPPPYVCASEVKVSIPTRRKITHNKNQLSYREEIGKGRFAIILKVLIRNEKGNVAAAKKLRSGYKPEDVGLMEEKIDFLRDDVPPHVNIVRYMGESQDTEDGPPVLLLEFCELNLLDWLKGLNEINSTIEAHLINIALNIARGMEHLHKNKIIHKRLSCRNVLLNENLETGEYVAKLIGFGAMSEKRMKEGHIEWLAPETIESMNNRPIYNKKTDSWSYGIVLWEMFSKGEVPYPDVSRKDLLSHLKSGGRMKRPDYMPQELFEDVVQQCWQSYPASRPEFSAICETVTTFRDGQEQPLYRAESEISETQSVYADGR